MRKQALPPVPTRYNGPTIQSGVDNARDMIFVVTNDAHSRGTNPGYIRKGCGGFFYHWKRI